MSQTNSDTASCKHEFMPSGYCMLCGAFNTNLFSRMEPARDPYDWTKFRTTDHRPKDKTEPQPITIKNLLIKAEEEIGDILAVLSGNLIKEGFSINQIFMNPYGRKVDSDPPGYGYYQPGVRIVIQQSSTSEFSFYQSCWYVRCP